MCLAVCGLQDTESSCCHNVRPISRSIARSANFYLLSGDVLANYSHPQRAGRAIRCQTQPKKKNASKNWPSKTAALNQSARLSEIIQVETLPRDVHSSEVTTATSPYNSLFFRYEPTSIASNVVNLGSCGSSNLLLHFR